MTSFNATSNGKAHKIHCKYRFKALIDILTYWSGKFSHTNSCLKIFMLVTINVKSFVAAPNSVILLTCIRKYVLSSHPILTETKSALFAFVRI